MPQDTPLHKACGKGTLPEIQGILDAAADEAALKALVNAPGAAERTPLHRAAGGNFTEVCKLARGRVRVGEEGYHLLASLGPLPPPMTASQAFPECRYASLPVVPFCPPRRIFWHPPSLPH